MKKEITNNSFKYLIILKDGDCQGVTYCETREEALDMLRLNYDRVEIYEHNGKFYEFVGYAQMVEEISDNNWERDLP